MITVSIPCLPPSTNNAYATVNGRRVPTKQAKTFKELVEWSTLAQTNRKPLKGILSVSLTFYSETWFTKAGEPRVIDLGNLEKLLVDSVFKALGMKDHMIFELKLMKLIGPEQSIIRISQMGAL